MAYQTAASVGPVPRESDLKSINWWAQWALRKVSKGWRNGLNQGGVEKVVHGIVFICIYYLPGGQLAVWVEFDGNDRSWCFGSHLTHRPGAIAASCLVHVLLIKL
ncbi:hypothetical protein PanWU01x14_356000 [Parasponia andersonii]|uniref:Uncharacterized protein n=1 Tax=Parasponia andersonii TaxID=3476 RepID=A0A2P5A941_PARAD|nr:hypothetical protein PanWU01x14_356000 [Parasponia andersonii]